jgi:integrase
MANSTRKHVHRKSSVLKKYGLELPYPEFPLYAHPLGYWSKKIRGKIKSFGRWARVVNGVLTPVPFQQGWQDALAVYKAQVDDLQAGRTPRVKMGSDGKPATADVGLTVKDLCNRFLTAKQRRLDAGKMVKRSMDEYKATCERLAAVFGSRRVVDDLRPDDFDQLLVEISKTWGAIRVGNEITRVKSVFKFGRENGLIIKPIPFGSEFKKPDKKELRMHNAARGKRMLEAEEIRRLIAAAKAPEKAMLLLGLNGGFGNHDVATLPESAVDLEVGWINFPRPKTGIERRCPLWPETVAAIREAIAERPEPREDAAKGIVFVTARGRQFLSNGIAHPVTCVIVKLMKETGVHREGIGFYTLRHVFRTVADATLDRVAIDRIMGHSNPTMAGHYIERIDDVRLIKVTEYVRRWLFGEPPAAPKADTEAPQNGKGPRPKNAKPTPTPTAAPTLRLYVAEEGGAA